MKIVRIYFFIVVILTSFSSEGAPDCHTKNLSTCQQMLDGAPYYRYPYHDLHLILENEGIDTVKIFSYGSLMDYDSASKTLSSGSMDTLRPAIAFGVKRLFNRDVPIKPNSKWGIPNDDNARGMLNLALTNNHDNKVNGIVFEVNRNDLPNLLFREEGYDLMPVIIADWEDAAQKEETATCDIAYTFYAPPESSYVSDHIYPRPNYYELSRDASLHYGPVFHHLWFTTTYFSDGVTPISEWENMVQANETISKTR